MKIQTNYIQRQNQYGETYRMSYSAWGNPNASQVLFCVHGLNRNSRDFDYVADYLVEYGYYVVAPDLPGRGNSDYLQDPRGYSLECASADLLFLIAQLQFERLDFLGVSLGGILGMVVASLPNSRLQKLILSDIGAEVELEGIARIAAYTAQQPDFSTFAQAESYLRDLSQSDGIYAEEVWQHMLINSLQKNSQQRWELKRDVNLAKSLANEVAMEGNLKLWPYWEKIHIPTLIIHGQSSDILSRVTIRKMHLSNPLTKVLTVSDAGHSPYLYRSEHLKVIADFLSKKSA